MAYGIAAQGVLSEIKTFAKGGLQGVASVPDSDSMQR